MTVKSRRDAVRKSAISFDSIRNTVRSFNKSISMARGTAGEILKQTRQRNKFKRELTAKDNNFFRRRQENIKRKQREDELEAQDVKKLPKQQGNIITRSTRGLLGRLLDFLGVLLIGFVINNLPRIIKATSDIIKKIKKVISVLDPFIKTIQFFLTAIGTGITAVLGIFKRFDFRKNKKNIDDAVNQANNNILKADNDFRIIINEFEGDENVRKVPEMNQMLDDDGDVEDTDQEIQPTMSVEDVEIEKRAEGGIVEKGQPYIVGEEGAELFVPEEKGDVITDEQLGEFEGMMDNEEVEGMKNDTDISKIRPPKDNDGSGIIPTPPDNKETSISDVLLADRKKKESITSVNKNVNVASSIVPITRERTNMVSRKARIKRTVITIEKQAPQDTGPSMMGKNRSSVIVTGSTKSDVLKSLQGLSLKKN